MKTIEEALNNPAINRGLVMSSVIQIAERSFKSGVEFAQRWIPIEEELPVKGGSLFNDSDTVLIKVLLKDGNIKILTGHYDLSMKDWYIDATHYNGIVIEWRPIKYN